MEFVSHLLIRVSPCVAACQGSVVHGFGSRKSIFVILLILLILSKTIHFSVPKFFCQRFCAFVFVCFVAVCEFVIFLSVFIRVHPWWNFLNPAFRLRDGLKLHPP